MDGFSEGHLTSLQIHRVYMTPVSSTVINFLYISEENTLL